jgi:hypothetical protein
VGTVTKAGAIAGRIDDKITVADLDSIGGDSAAGADSAAVPIPTVLGDKASAAGSESIVLAVAFDDGGRVMDVWTPYLCGSHDGEEQCREGS